MDHFRGRSELRRFVYSVHRFSQQYCVLIPTCVPLGRHACGGRLRAMRAERFLTPVTRILLALQALLVLTGGAVRVTGSGLGCPTWPECTADSYTPVEGQAEGAFHAWIEFGNRLLTFLLLFAAIAVVATRSLSAPKGFASSGSLADCRNFGSGSLRWNHCPYQT